MNGASSIARRCACYAVAMRIQSLNHSTYQHQYHIVWGTKYRRKFLKPYVKSELLRSFYDTVHKYPTLRIETMNLDDDHLHMQIEIPPSISVASAVQALKANASTHLKKRFEFIKKMYLDEGIWSVGYFSSTIGLNEHTIRKYIENQGQSDLPVDVTQRFKF